MRKIVLYAGMGICLILFILMSVTIHFRNTRAEEIGSGLHEALDGTIQTLLEENMYTISDANIFVADLLERLIVTLNSDSEVEVNVLQADVEKGLLRVEVIQRYEHVNGSIGSVSCERTVLLDSPQENMIESRQVYLYLTKTDMENEDGSYQNCYKIYEVRKGENLSLQAPEPSGGFTGWKLADGSILQNDAAVNDNLSAYAFE